MSEERAVPDGGVVVYSTDPREQSGFTKRLVRHPGLPPLLAQRPGAVTDAADGELAALRVAVVEPVVAGLLTNGEVDEVELARGVAPQDREVWVRVVARGEVFTDLLTSPDWEGGDDAVEVAARLADHLEDWVCEATFAWGQRRTAHYVLPPA